MSISRPGCRRQPSLFTELRTGVPLTQLFLQRSLTRREGSIQCCCFDAGRLGRVAMRVSDSCGKSAAAVGQPFRGNNGEDDELRGDPACLRAANSPRRFALQPTPPASPGVECVGTVEALGRPRLTVWLLLAFGMSVEVGWIQEPNGDASSN